jgi:hypothetical protein
MRGQHFGFLVSLCAVWIAARVGFLSVLPPAGVAPQIDRLKIESLPRPNAFAATIEGGRPRLRAAASSRLAPHHLAPFRRPPTSGVISPKAVRLPPADARFMPDEKTPASSQPLLSPSATKSRDISPLNVYAYSFIRAGMSGRAPLGSGQYGGSQSGLITTYALARSGETGRTKLALLLRAAVAHNNVAESELATGFRWHPVPDMPFSLTVERRFRNARSDAFAAYIAGGVSEAKLPLEFRMDAFAQAGLVTNKDGRAFFDASARAERDLAQVGGIPIRAGVGLWTGGQQDIFRVDVGPTISGQIPIADTRLRVSADWRFRIAGDARPASGPALTLSTGF